MNATDFILNGGLLGLLRNFDHIKEGRPYGFGEFKEDTASVKESLDYLIPLKPLTALDGGNKK